ncbi:hypothetical protein HpDR98_02770 [Helicobacter pylori]
MADFGGELLVVQLGVVLVVQWGELLVVQLGVVLVVQWGELLVVLRLVGLAD